MQKQGFWVGLTKFELNQEIQQQKSEKETLNEENISADKLNRGKEFFSLFFIFLS